MNIKMAAQVIRDQVTMDEILGLYGYRAKHGFMCCPFHGEKAPSLKIYPGTGGWHCFGCGRGGSVIDFVMEHEGCDFRTAVNAIDQQLRLGLADPYENPMDARSQQRMQNLLDNFMDAVDEYCDEMLRWIERTQILNYKKMFRLEELRQTDIQKISAKDWDFILTFKEEDEYNDYIKEKIEDIREEVKSWRREARRKK